MTGLELYLGHAFLQHIQKPTLVEVVLPDVPALALEIFFTNAICGSLQAISNYQGQLTGRAQTQ